MLTTTRVIGEDGLGKKTRVLDAAQTGGAEIEAMRGIWAELQNQALERAGEAGRVDHRSLEVQREAAEQRGDLVAAEELDRAPEVKLGPAANAMERRAAREAEAAGRAYAPVTERGRAVHEVREARRVLAALREELRERVETAREAYGQARGEGQDRVSAGLAAMRAALEKQREAPEADERIGDRLKRMLARDAERGLRPGGQEQDDVRTRLNAALGRGRGLDSRRSASLAQAAERAERGPKTETERERRDDRPLAEKMRGRGRERDDDGYER